MTKSFKYVLTSLFVVFYSFFSSANINKIEMERSDFGPVKRNVFAPADSIPVVLKPMYEKAINYIVNDEQIRVGLSILVNKKINKREKIKIKVSESMFVVPMPPQDTFCKVDIMSDLSFENNFDGPNFSLSKCSDSAKKYSHVVFFSPLYNNVIECRIVRATNSSMDDDFFIRTRFGKVLTVKFCFNNSEIYDVKISLTSAG